MKIVKLQVENIKKIKAIEITPDGNMIVLSGKNEQGKTTVLDSIWWAIGGTKEIQNQPLRTGEKKGKIVLDLGDMIATRKFTEKGSTLEVVNKEGMKYPSPQAVLDKLVSRYSFDIQEFAEADKKAQVETLLSIVEIPLDPAKLQQISGVAISPSPNPLDTLNAAYKAVYDERTIANRELTKAKATFESMAKAEPAEPVSLSELVVEKEELEKHNRANEQKRQHRNTLQTELETKNATLNNTSIRIAELKEEIRRLEKQETAEIIDRDTAWQALEDYDKELALLQDKDLTDINTRITNADETNRKARAYTDYQAAEKAYNDKQTEADGYTAKLNAIKEYKDELMKQVKFPIDGLGFANGGVTYQDLPFEQASGAQKLQVSCAIAMALNPNLKVLRINDRAAFDSEHWAIVEQMAKDKDFQVWSEAVDESGKVGIVIEDGTVKAVNKEE